MKAEWKSHNKKKTKTKFENEKKIEKHYRKKNVR